MIRFVAAAILVLLLSFAPAPAQAVDGFEVTYVVKKGDSLGRIARQHKVTVRQITRWNKMRSTKIRVGQKLKLYSPIPKRPTRMTRYRIVRGDTLKKIAKKFGTTVKQIQRLNRIRGRRIIAGKTLKIEIPGPENPSCAMGRPQRGKLVNGEKLPPGPGYFLKRPDHAWGTNRVITHLMMVLPKVRQRWKKKAPDVVIEDLSRKNGGSFAPHRSHQNGLDVDVGYYHKVKRPSDHPKTFRNVTPQTLDVAKTWLMLEGLLDTGHVEFMFIDRSLHAVLLDYAKRKGKRRKHKKEWLKKVFGTSSASGIIRHSKSHKNHIHIRFLPAPEDEKPGQKKTADEAYE